MGFQSQAQAPSCCEVSLLGGALGKRSGLAHPTDSPDMHRHGGFSSSIRGTEAASVLDKSENKIQVFKNIDLAMYILDLHPQHNYLPLILRPKEWAP